MPLAVAPSNYLSPSQFHGRCRPCQTCAEGHHNDPVAFAAAPHLARLIQRDRHAGRAGVPVFVDVDEDLLLGEPHLFGRGIDDALIDLVRHDQLHGVRRQAATLHRRAE